MSAPKAVKELVDRFNTHRDTYLAQKYNETQLRREFIDPFFKALGWDIDNTQGFAEAYKDVIHEDAIKIGTSNRAPDYCFRVGGVRKFFLEAKKPSTSISDDDVPAYQLRRYGWSAKLSLSILTNFRELAIYDCRVKPEKSHKAHTARVALFGMEEYISKWDDLTNIFSKEAILKGSFDKYVTAKKNKGTSLVDDEFLAEIESWRENLAKNFALRNPNLTQADLNFAVQATIDRIVFLRICEDRGIEPYGQLQKHASRADAYHELTKLFRTADDKYNSGLFHFRDEKNRPEAPDALSLALKLDDKPLQDIISGLYFPESPYEFSVIGADILGQVYEQFLGRVIRLTPAHRAIIDEKPEVKKAGGVYYTPTYIVDYIVERTVGAWLKGKSVKQATSLKVLDPACGSGSFLIAVYQFLLDWYLAQYLKDISQAKKRIYKDAAGDWRLTLKERKRILLEHVFGVDVDRQAVEVSKLSLLLKVLERESDDTLKKQFELFHERALPDLGDNIKCGNSLVGPSYLVDQQFDLLDEQRVSAINVFDWDAEFADIAKAGGFDVIVGNPPYVNAWTMYENAPELRDYFNRSGEYESADRHWDLYVLFIEKSIRLLKRSGLLSFIIPFSYCIQKYASKSRRALTESFMLRSIADLRTIKVFKKVPVITIIPVIQKKKASNNEIEIVAPMVNSAAPPSLVPKHVVQQSAFIETEEAMWRLDWNAEAIKILKAIDAKSFPFGDIGFVNYGAQMSSKKKGEFGKDFVLRDKASSATCKKTISGRNLYRYQIDWDGQFVEWALSPKMYGAREAWFFETPKLMIRDITGTHRLELSLDRTKLYCDHTVLCALRACDIGEHREFDEELVALSAMYSHELLLALLGSRLVSAYYYWSLTGEGVRTGGGFHTYPTTIRALPLFDLQGADKKTKELLLDLENVATSMLSVKEKAKSSKQPHERRTLENQFTAFDRRVDEIVYSLYGLSKSQIKAIEAATG